MFAGIFSCTPSFSPEINKVYLILSYLMFRLTHSIHLCFGLPLPRRLLPCGTISVVDLPTISWSRLFTCPHHLSLVFLHLHVMFSSFSISLMLSTVFSRILLLFGLSTHLHLRPYQFLHGSHRHCLHLVQHRLAEQSSCESFH